MGLAPAEGRTIQVVRDSMNRVRGQLFGAVEAVGLPGKQEAAFKGLIRDYTTRAQTDIEAEIREPNG